MNELALKGKKQTLLISLSIVLVSLITIIQYQLSVDELVVKKLVQQIIRFILTLVMMFFILKKKTWALVMMILLLSAAVLMAIDFIIFEELPFMAKIPLMVMAFVYSIALYHFAFSKSFKAFFKPEIN
jgi:hypothetical protein